MFPDNSNIDNHNVDTPNIDNQKIDNQKIDNQNKEDIGIFGKINRWFFGTKVTPPYAYQKQEQRFDEVWASAVSTFKANKRINIIVVSIGIILIAYGLIYQWYDSFIYVHPAASQERTNVDQTNVTNENSTENQSNIPNLTGLISSGTGLATIVGLFFFRSQAHIQRGFTNLALTNMISTANLWSFRRLDWLLWVKYVSPLLDKNDPDYPKGDVSSIKNIDISEFTGIINSVRNQTTQYSEELYNRTRLMEEMLEQQNEVIKKDDKVTTDKGNDGTKTDPPTNEKK